MTRKLRIWCGLLIVAILAVAAGRQLRAFTTWGQLETFQTAALSYGTRFWYSPVVSLSNNLIFAPGNGVYTESGGPKNFGEGSRLNVPTITYAYDQSFLTYFGSDGVKAVDSAFAILNRLPPVSSASPNLTEFIQQGNEQINYTARALNMMDMKSVVLQLMIEHMGLLGETHVFDIGAQVPLGPTCDSEYFIYNWNWDPITYNATTAVNGTTYGFIIKDGCPAGTAIADAMETANGDPSGGLSFDTCAVATAEALQLGGYYIGITRDDFGGLRYLYRQNNYVPEAMPDANTYVSSTITSAFGGVNTNAADNAWAGTVGGIEKITFVKVTLNSGFGPNGVTNVIHYNLPILTNGPTGRLITGEVGVYRTNSFPDIIFTAANLLGTPAAGQDQPYTRTNVLIAFPTAAINGNSTLPEVISPTNLITFNNAGPIGLYFNPDVLQLGTALADPYFQFGSFDGSTNPPIAFPQGTKLASLINILMNAPAFPLSSGFNAVQSTNTTTGGGTAGGTAGGTGATGANARRNGNGSP